MEKIIEIEGKYIQIPELPPCFDDEKEWTEYCEHSYMVATYDDKKHLFKAKDFHCRDCTEEFQALKTLENHCKYLKIVKQDRTQFLMEVTE